MTGRPAPLAAVVEFAGLPGVGKTTVSGHTQAALVERGVVCTVADAGVSAAVRRPVRVGRRLALASAQLARRPSAAVTALRALRGARQESVLDGLAGVVQWFAVQRLGVRSRRCRGVHLLEEGQVQTLWTLTLRTRGDALPRVMSGLPAGYRPDLIVVVEAPVDQVSSRLGARASTHSRTQRLPEPRRTHELERGRELLEEILDKTDCGQLRLTNDGRATPEELGRRVADWVLSSLSAPESPKSPIASRDHRCHSMWRTGSRLPSNDSAVR